VDGHAALLTPFLSAQQTKLQGAMTVLQYNHLEPSAPLMPTGKHHPVSLSRLSVYFPTALLCLLRLIWRAMHSYVLLYRLRTFFACRGALHVWLWE